MPVENDLEDFLEHSLSGYISTDIKGAILKSNIKIRTWLDYEEHELIGKRISSMLAVGSRMFHETHLSPLLKLKGFFEEMSAEMLTRDGNKIQVLMNAYVRNDKADKQNIIFWNFYRATERKVYEDNLRHSILDGENALKDELAMAKLREQFIAVLGHDLRNPLGAIKSGASLLKRSQLSEREIKIIGTIDRSVFRMEELIANVMDFARVRLGEGIKLTLKEVDVQPVLKHIVEELAIAFPNRKVYTELNVPEMILCDENRISQMLSNLLANALTHGDVDQPVKVIAELTGSEFMLAVKNGGKPIPEEVIHTLFEPFTREAETPSQQGLGLGLYIAYQIAIAHKGDLTAVSTLQDTIFSFRMPVILKHG